MPARCQGISHIFGKQLSNSTDDNNGCCWCLSAVSTTMEEREMKNIASALGRYRSFSNVVSFMWYCVIFIALFRRSIRCRLPWVCGTLSGSKLVVQSIRIEKCIKYVFRNLSQFDWIFSWINRDKIWIINKIIRMWSQRIVPLRQRNYLILLETSRVTMTSAFTSIKSSLLTIRPIPSKVELKHSKEPWLTVDEVV